MNTSHSERARSDRGRVTIEGARSRRQAAGLSAGDDCARQVEELDPAVSAVVELASLREHRGIRQESALTGTAVFVKDNMSTCDGTLTGAGSFALLQNRVVHEASVVRAIRRAGGVIVGKTNMSEWGNFRSRNAISGWSARGGQCRNPFDLARTPWGSSSGSAVAVALGMAPVALGTETDGSVLLPASVNGVVGFKASPWSLPTGGVVPILPGQDSIGVFCNSVDDVSSVVDALLVARGQASNLADSTVAASRYPDDVVRNLRLTVVAGDPFDVGPAAVKSMAAALSQLSTYGTTSIFVDVTGETTLPRFLGPELDAMCVEFAAALSNYLDRWTAGPLRGVSDIVEYNRGHAAEELALFGQDILERADHLSRAQAMHLRSTIDDRRRVARRLLDGWIAATDGDVVVTPTAGPAFLIDYIAGDRVSSVSTTLAAQAGYPAISIPILAVGALPVGLLMIGRPNHEASLLAAAAAVTAVCGLTPAPASTVLPSAAATGLPDSPTVVAPQGPQS